MRRSISALAIASMLVGVLGSTAGADDTRYAGAPLQKVIRVNHGGGATYQWAPSVAPDTVNGNYLVAWEDDRSGGPQIFARLFNASGDPVTGDRRISPVGQNATQARAVYIESTSQFLVFWRSSVIGGTSLMVRRLGADGHPVGGVRTLVDGTLQHGWDVAVNTSSGHVMLAWRENFDLRARALLSTGRPAGRSWLVAADSLDPALAYNENDDQFGVVYTTTINPRVEGRRLVGATGQPTSAKRTISSNAAIPRDPDLAFDPGVDRFMVIWEDGRASADTRGGPTFELVYGRQMTSHLGLLAEGMVGQAMSAEDARIAANPIGGGYVAGWTDDPVIRVQEITAHGKLNGPARGISGPGSEASIGFDIACNTSGGACLTVWQDRRREATRGVDILGRIISAGEWIIKPGRVGPIKLGHSIAGLPSSTGMPWTVTSPGAPNCKVAEPVTGDWVHVQGYITVRDIWVEERHTGRTPEGIRVGDTKQQVLNAYGSRASVEPGPYVGEMIVVDGPLSTDWGYVFDMPSGGIVSTIYIANHAKIAAGGCT